MKNNFKQFQTLVLLLCLTAFAANDVQAQRTTRESTRRVDRVNMSQFGLFAGLNLSRLQTESQDVNSYGKAGFLGGVFYRLNIGNLYFQPELVFNMRGGELQAAGGERSQIDFYNLDLPLIAGFKLFTGPKGNFRIMGGPVASYAMAIDGDFGDEQADVYFQRAQWNLQAGLGFDILFFTMDIRYEWGLNDLRTANASRNQTPDEPGTRAVFTEAVNNHNIRLHVGFIF